MWLKQEDDIPSVENCEERKEESRADLASDPIATEVDESKED